MLRMSKLADYGAVIMTFLAHEPQRLHKAGEVADGVSLALPTVSKLLKTLARAGLLNSQRGMKGGFMLARPAERISVAAIVRAVDGPVALTDCVAEHGLCAREHCCAVRGNWRHINDAVEAALEGVSLAQMARPARVAPLRRVAAKG